MGISPEKMRMAPQIQDLFHRIEKRMLNNQHSCSCDPAEFFKSALSLCTIFGEEVVIDGIEIAENGLVRIVRDEQGMLPYLLEVRTGSFCSNSYYIYENANFCRCVFFTKEVLSKERNFTCPHLLAVFFTKICGWMKPDRVENSTIMETILRTISTPSECDLRSIEGAKIITAVREAEKESAERLEEL